MLWAAMVPMAITHTRIHTRMPTAMAITHTPIDTAIIPTIIAIRGVRLYSGATSIFRHLIAPLRSMDPPCERKGDPIFEI